MWMSHVTHEWVISQIEWVVSQIEWVLLKIEWVMSKSEWVMSQIEWVMSHMNESCHRLNEPCHTWMSHVTDWMSHVTHKWVMSHIWNESCHTWDMSHIWRCHVTHVLSRMNKSCHTYKCVMHVTHMNVSCMSHIWIGGTGWRRRIGSLIFMRRIPYLLTHTHTHLWRRIPYPDMGWPRSVGSIKL